MANRTARDPSKRPSPRGDLKQATVETIDREVSRAYERAAAAGEKPPNVVEILAPVRASLAVLGYFATKSQIQKVAKSEQHAGRRLPKGRPA
jgi:hypothetical protein